MVSSIIPGATGAATLGVDPRYTRSAPQTPQREENAPAGGDRVEIGASSWLAARESVRDGLSKIQDAVSVGRAAQTHLTRLRDAAAEGDGVGFEAALGELVALIDDAVARGGGLLAGGDLAVQAEPGAAPVLVRGVDLRLKEEPSADEAIAVRRGAQLSDGAPQLVADAQKSLDTLQAALERLSEAVRALEAHQGFLGAVEGASAVRQDLDADTARLLALQVRQGLDAANGASIANVEPQAVLSLFRA